MPFSSIRTFKPSGDSVKVAMPSMLDSKVVPRIGAEAVSAKAYCVKLRINELVMKKSNRFIKVSPFLFRQHSLTKYSKKRKGHKFFY
jgi:hypothetical protein